MIQEYKNKRIETIFTIAVGFCVVSGILFWKYDEFFYWPLIVSGAILLIGFLVPVFGLAITICWFKVAELMGWFSSKVILSLLYFFFITPYSLLIRMLSSKDVLQQKRKESLFVERNHKYEPKDLENPW